MTEHAPARELGNAVLGLWYLAWMTVMGAAIWFKYRRLSP
jgi:hypothetical protein